jgi:hypothetical protein
VVVPRLAGAGRWSAAGRPADRAPLPPGAPSRAASSPPPATAGGRPPRERRGEGSPYSDCGWRRRRRRWFAAVRLPRTEESGVCAPAFVHGFDPGERPEVAAGTF